MPADAQVEKVIASSAFFDEDWYLARYPDVGMLDITPARHYVLVGASLRRDPGPAFSTRFYLEHSPDVEAAGVNALWHYEVIGRSEGRPSAHFDWDRPPALPDAPTPKLEAAPLEEKAARLIAFYLPQFHPIPENDEWWGKGFTEWTNVRPTRPMMPGHHQPHIPGELGYYDLRDREVQRRQIELARLYGVEAFCFYFYWFAGKRLLEQPIRNYLEDETLDLPFLLCWANENWSRRWDGREDDVLMAQQHSPEDDLAFIEYVAEYLRDPRYLRIGGKPVLLVYRPNLLPAPAETTERWRTWCRENGIGEIYLAYTQSFESHDPADYGFDAATEFPPNNSDVPLIKEPRASVDFKGQVFDWSALARRSYSYAMPPYALHRGVNPSWDNTARRRANGTVLVNNTPALFTRWTTHAFRDTAARFSDPEQRLVFVNAWNEWGEGAHLEPDNVFGYAWLEGVRVAHACALPVRRVEQATAQVHVLDGSLAEVLPHLDQYDVLVRPGEGLNVADAVAALESDDRLGAVFGSRAASGTTPLAAGLAERLGLTPGEVTRAARWDTSAFVARASALRPLAALALDDESRASIESSVPASVSACGLRARSADGVPTPSRAVLIVTHDAHPHGAQRLALHLALTYRALGLEVHVLALGGGPLLAQFRETAAVHLVHPGRHVTANVAQLLQELGGGLDFAVVNTTVSGTVAATLRAFGLPTVALVHEMPRVLEEYQLAEQARAIADHADQVVFPAEIVRAGFESFVGTVLERATIRPQGRYLQRAQSGGEQRDAVRERIRSRLGLPVDCRIILGVGYADHRKGIDLWAAAAAQVLAAEPGAAAVWVGNADAEPLAGARKLLQDAGVDARFRLTGLVDNPQDFYAAADVFVLSSREDPFPSVVLEAMDAALPVVAFSGATGCEDLLRQGGGMLVDPMTGEALGSAQLALLRDAARAGELGAEGRRLVSTGFDFRDYAYDLAELAGAPLSRVSVVVPNFNYAEFIVDRLDSVLNQSVRIHELIVLDDASSDDSVQRIRERLTDVAVPWQLIENETNSGSVFAQWQRGAALATGDLVWIAEADDLADPDFLASLVPAFADPDVVLSYSQSRQMSGDGKIMCEHYLDYVADVHPSKWHSSHVAPGSEEIAEALYVKNTIPNVSAVVFRRSSLVETLTEHFDEISSYRNAGDWVAYARLLEHGKIAFCSRSLNSHRRHQKSVTLDSFNLSQLREIVAVQRNLIERHALGHRAVTAAANYAQVLYEQFGLQTPEFPRFDLHPELAMTHEVRQP